MQKSRYRSRPARTPKHTAGGQNCQPGDRTRAAFLCASAVARRSAGKLLGRCDSEEGLRVTREDLSEVCPGEPTPLDENFAEQCPIVNGASKVAMIERRGCEARPTSMHFASDDAAT